MGPISRRRFLALGALSIAGVGAASATTFTTSDIEFRTLKVPLKNLPPSFAGYRIGFLTDIHLSTALPAEWIRDSLSYFAREKIDILVLGGDYIWTRTSDMSTFFPIDRNKAYSGVSIEKLPGLIYPDFADIVSSISPPDGKLAVLGNHDGWTAPKVCQIELSRRGITVLENAFARIERGKDSLLFYGTEDYWTGIPKLPWNLKIDQTRELCIFLCHNPDFIGTSLHYPLPFALSLAGHTHGGQIRLPIIGSPFYNIHDLRFTGGMSVIDGRTIFVSRGLGVVEIPFRINCRPEATVLELGQA